MEHQTMGNYAEKHPGSTKNKDICARIEPAASNGEIDCAAAHRIAKQLRVPPADIGVQIDLMELRISRCQLGLFGYGPGKKNFDPDVQIPDTLQAAVIEAQTDGCLSCSQCWEMATRFKITRNQMGSTCERLEIRIKPCQLGAF